MESESGRMEHAKSTILFVDDEENIRLGIKRIMRSKRNDWVTLFADGGEQALSLLKEESVDVIVSDMKMPGMDGSELLLRVQQEHPEIIRIVLSGFADKEAILKTIGPSHHYLAKPCDQNTLIETIQRSLNLRAMLRNSSVRKIVSGINSIPILPEIFQDLLKELESEYSSADSLAEKVVKDVAISTQLMKLTNSAYFSLPVHATTPKKAIFFLGFENVKAIVLLGGVFDLFKTNQKLTKVAETLNKRSLQLGILTRAIASADNASKEEQEQAFCAGLVSHIGTLLLVANWPDKFAEIVSLVENQGLSISTAEHQVIGVTHGELGAYLLGLWGFKDPIVEAVAFHHIPGQCIAHSPKVLIALHMAQHLLRVEQKPELEESRIDQSLDEEFISSHNKNSMIEPWRAVYKKVSKGWPND
jgi:HD-like signal output (HDOD) protein/CheY-like chemotaxis protein